MSEIATPAPARRSPWAAVLEWGFSLLVTAAVLVAVLIVFGIIKFPAGQLTVNGQPVAAPQVRNLAPTFRDVPAAPVQPAIVQPEPAAPDVADSVMAVEPAPVQGVIEAAPAGVTSGAGGYVEQAPVEPAGVTGAIDAAPQPAGVGGLAGGLNFDGGATGAVESGGGITGGAGALTK